MSRVELVKFLIESNFYEVPSIEDLMSAQTARSVRLRHDVTPSYKFCGVTDTGHHDL